MGYEGVNCTHTYTDRGYKYSHFGSLNLLQNVRKWQKSSGDVMDPCLRGDLPSGMR